MKRMRPRVGFIQALQITGRILNEDKLRYDSTDYDLVPYEDSKQLRILQLKVAAEDHADSSEPQSSCIKLPMDVKKR